MTGKLTAIQLTSKRALSAFAESIRSGAGRGLTLLDSVVSCRLSLGLEGCLPLARDPATHAAWTPAPETTTPRGY